MKWKSKALSHLERDNVVINFSGGLTAVDLGAEVVVKVLSNVEDRVQRVVANQQLLIIRRRHDDAVLTSIITDNDVNEVQKFLKSLNDDQIYDIVLISKYNKEYEGVGNIKIRYFNYVGCDEKTLEITLLHPNELISASLTKIRIINLNRCINLRNLSSIFNSYKKSDFEEIRNLKRIITTCDKYESDNNCFIQDLFN